MTEVRLVSFSVRGLGSKYGLVSADGGGVIDLSRRIESASNLSQLIERGELGRASDFASDEADFELSQIKYERTIPAPGKIFCVGVNYGGRNLEYEDKSSAAYPSVFVRFPDSLTGHGQPLIRPPESAQLDYEGEIVVVIGRAGRRIPVDEARAHIAGLTIGNEGTIRDWVRHAKFNVTQGKNWKSSGSMGPWLVPVEEVGDFSDLRIQTLVNGELRQQDSPSTMKFSIEYQIHYLSTFIDLLPGDVIFTGTPTGAGARRDPPIWLAPGDQVDVTVEGLGTLSNPIADEFDSDLTIEPPRPQ